MPTAAPDWGLIPTTMQPHLAEYAELVRRLAGQNAIALTCFGAVTAGNFDPERGAAASALILANTDFPLLRALAEHGPRLGRHGIAAPWVMTTAYLDASRDTFPLRLIEVQQNHRTLFGPDLFSDLTFAQRDVRLQCERELKTILLHLQRGLLAAAGEARHLDVLASGIAAELIRTMRGLLWLRGERDARPAEAVIAAIETTYECSLTGVRQAADPHGYDTWQTFESLYHDVEALSEIADAE